MEDTNHFLSHKGNFMTVLGNCINGNSNQYPLFYRHIPVGSFHEKEQYAEILFKK